MEKGSGVARLLLSKGLCNRLFIAQVLSRHCWSYWTKSVICQGWLATKWMPVNSSKLLLSLDKTFGLVIGSWWSLSCLYTFFKPKLWRSRTVFPHTPFFFGSVVAGMTVACRGVDKFFLQLALLIHYSAEIKFARYRSLEAICMFLRLESKAGKSVAAEKAWWKSATSPEKTI